MWILRHSCYTILVNLCVLISALEALLEDIETCRKKSLPQGVAEWSEPSQAVTVEWGYDEICTSINECLKLSVDPDIVMEPQLLPVHVQIGTKVTFSLKRTDSSLAYLPYRVSEEDFRNCNFSSAVAIVADKTAGPIVVEQKYLQPGPNYFIAGTSDQLYKCEYGLRLNITVKTARCKYPRQPYTCFNHGRCVANKLQPIYTCECCHGYTGKFCDDIDACANRPCQNGGVCTDVPNDSTGKKFWCSCPIGYAGDVCTLLQKNPCDNHPCANNGTCIQTTDQFICRCLPGFTGTHCEVNINDCESDPCLHGGMCTDQIQGYKCQCPPGYYGTRCEFNRNECQINPCQNGGMCIDGVNQRSCECGIGYAGSTCEIKVNLCQNHECVNATQCIDMGNNYVCVCKPGFTGYRCEVNINECASYPCQNAGMCRDQIDGYTCTCPLHFAGKYCQIKDLDSTVVTDISGHHISHLMMAVGTLGGALLIALMVLGGCYCRQYRIHNYQQFEYSKYSKHSDIDLVNTPNVDISSVTEPRPSADAIYDAAHASYNDNTISSPLIHSLQPKRV